MLYFAIQWFAAKLNQVMVSLTSNQNWTWGKILHTLLIY